MSSIIKDFKPSHPTNGQERYHRRQQFQQQQQQQQQHRPRQPLGLLLDVQLPVLPKSTCSPKISSSRLNEIANDLLLQRKLAKRNASSRWNLENVVIQTDRSTYGGSGDRQGRSNDRQPDSSAVTEVRVSRGKRTKLDVFGLRPRLPPEVDCSKLTLLPLYRCGSAARPCRLGVQLTGTDNIHRERRPKYFAGGDGSTKLPICCRCEDTDHRKSSGTSTPSTAAGKLYGLFSSTNERNHEIERSVNRTAYTSSKTVDSFDSGNSLLQRNFDDLRSLLRISSDVVRERPRRNSDESNVDWLQHPTDQERDKVHATRSDLSTSIGTSAAAAVDADEKPPDRDGPQTTSELQATMTRRTITVFIPMSFDYEETPEWRNDEADNDGAAATTFSRSRYVDPAVAESTADSLVEDRSRPGLPAIQSRRAYPASTCSTRSGGGGGIEVGGSSESGAGVVVVRTAYTHFDRTSQEAKNAYPPLSYPLMRGLHASNGVK